MILQTHQLQRHTTCSQQEHQKLTRHADRNKTNATNQQTKPLTQNSDLT